LGGGVRFLIPARYSVRQDEVVVFVPVKERYSLLVPPYPIFFDALMFRFRTAFPDVQVAVFPGTADSFLSGFFILFLLPPPGCRSALQAFPPRRRPLFPAASLFLRS